MKSNADSPTPQKRLSAPIFRLTLPYRTPNNANARKHWRAIVAEKHKAQACFMSALRSAEKACSILTQNMRAQKTYSTACNMLGLFLATKRVKSLSKLNKLSAAKAKLKKR